MLGEEFNCNHQADLTGDANEETQEQIFTRANEQREISQFMLGNIRDKKSGLMYLCGHPGTGKTSCLNIILHKMQKAVKNGNLAEFELFMYNAMTFTDVKSFALTLLQDVTQAKLHEETNRVDRSKYDNEELSIKVAKALSIGNDKKSKALAKYKDVRLKHNIIVIDEVD